MEAETAKPDSSKRRFREPGLADLRRQRSGLDVVAHAMRGDGDKPDLAADHAAIDRLGAGPLPMQHEAIGRKHADEGGELHVANATGKDAAVSWSPPLGRRHADRRTRKVHSNTSRIGARRERSRTLSASLS